MEGFIGRLIFIDIYDIFVRLEVRLEAKVDKCLWKDPEGVQMTSKSVKIHPRVPKLIPRGLK